jgi:peroxiredoxin
MKIILLASIGVLLMTCKTFAQTTPAKTLPQFEFSRLNQSTFTNKDLPAGKILFFMFFDSDCDHCQRAIHEIEQEYKCFQQTVICLVSLDDKNKINHFISGYAPRLKAQKNVVLLQDTKNQFIALFNPLRYPAMFLYSKDKKLIDYEDNELTVFRLVNTIRKNG